MAVAILMAFLVGVLVGYVLVRGNDVNLGG